VRVVAVVEGQRVFVERARGRPIEVRNQRGRFQRLARGEGVRMSSRPVVDHQLSGQREGKEPHGFILHRTSSNCTYGVRHVS
jgi:hypothetical protein